MSEPYSQEFYKELEKFYYHDDYVRSVSEMILSTVISFDMQKELSLDPITTENDILIELSKRLLLMGNMLKKHGETYYPAIFNSETLS